MHHCFKNLSSTIPWNNNFVNQEPQEVVKNSAWLLNLKFLNYFVLRKTFYMLFICCHV